MADPRFVLPPYPLEHRVRAIFDDLRGGVEFTSTGLDRETYLDLAERIVRSALPWQDERGAIISPALGRETSTTSGRFVGALGGCIRGGRCADLVAECALSMDYCCEMMAGRIAPYASFHGPEFYTKELMYAYFALDGKVSAERHRRWGELLGAFDVWERYPSWHNVSDGNFPIYGVCGEQLKVFAGLADTTEALEAVLDNQFKLLTPWGMYRDPHDPLTYDLTDRQQLGMLPHFGYRGRHAAWIDEATRRGALTQLLYMSVTGQMPYGGRSNQYHIMEAMAACICELEARRYRDSRPEYAGALKRAAHLAVASIAPWIAAPEQIYVIKNRFDASLAHGDAGYDGSPYAAYLLLIASILGTAHQLADESIPEGPAPVDRGGYAFQLWPAFHKTFATCGSYHLEIDNSGQPTHDATGLGRLHRRGVRPETALSMSIPATPAVHMSVAASPTYAAIGPYVAWGCKEAPLAAMAASSHCRGIFAADLAIAEETPQRVAFSLRYSGDLVGAQAVTEQYELTPDGLAITPSAEGGTLSRFAVPLLVTDGLRRSRLERLPDGFRVTYEGAIYEVRVSDPRGIELVLGAAELPNSNGLYRLAEFVGDVAGRTFTLTIGE